MLEQNNLRVFFSCTGVGAVNRGIESFFREAFDGLRESPALNVTPYKGAGPNRSTNADYGTLPQEWPSLVPPSAA